MKKVTFSSQGETLVGQLYLPAGAGVDKKVPGFVIIGPMTYQKEQAPSQYAQRLAAQGFAALVFDPRYRGESSGEPRLWENPRAKAQDIGNAALFLAGQPEIEAHKIFGLGICQGSSAMVQAVAENPLLKAGITVAGHYRDHEGDIAWLGEEGFQARLSQGQKAKEKYLKTGEVDYIPAVDETDLNVAMPGKFVWDWYHVWADKGLWENRYAVMSDADLLTYESLSFARQIDKPYLMIHSDNCFLPAAARRHFAAMPSAEKTLLWEDQTPHLDYYDNPEVLDRSVATIIRRVNRMMVKESADEAFVKNVVKAVGMLVDSRNFFALEQLFAAEVRVDYSSAFGGAAEIKTSRALIGGWAPLISGFDRTKHSLADLQAEVTGSRAKVTALVTAEHFLAGDCWQIGGSYRYSLEKKGGEWRVTEMVFLAGPEEGSRELIEKALQRSAAGPSSAYLQS